jgi:transcriptional regulatory protein LEU3
MVDETRAPSAQQQQQQQQQHPQQQQQIPVSKYPLDVVNNVPNAPVAIDFPAWDGDYNSIPPMLDQFPDYDWAASLDFANEWPNPVLAPLAPGNVGYAPGPMTFG